MRNEIKAWSLAVNSQTGGVHFFDLEGNRYVTDIAIRFCPWCARRIKLQFKRDPPLDEQRKEREREKRDSERDSSVWSATKPTVESIAADLFNDPEGKKNNNNKQDSCPNCRTFHRTGVDKDPVVFVCRCTCHSGRT